MNRQQILLPLSFLFILLITLLMGCAKQASPEGGPYDMIPPKLIKSTPVNGATNVKMKKIKLRFDENVKVEKQSEKVFFSPPQINPPKISHGTGRTITITYEDELLENTTYTIDFTDAIVDLNEGNPLEGFVFAFSTGNVIDSLQIRGQVIDAHTLEPVPDIFVGVYPDGDDSLFQTQPMLRTGRTMSDGRFTITHLAAGNYRLFALNDLDHSFSYSQRSEGFAFLAQSVPAVAPLPEKKKEQSSAQTDSVAQDSKKKLPSSQMTSPADSIAHMAADSTKHEQHEEQQTVDEARHLLIYSVDLPRKQFLQKNSRPDSTILTFNFNTSLDSIPQIEALNPRSNEKKWAYPKLNKERTELSFWIADSILYRSDTLQVRLTYAATDSADNWYSKSDTLSMVYRPQQKKQQVANKSKKEPKSLGKKEKAAPPIADSTATDENRDMVEQMDENPFGIKEESISPRLEMQITQRETLYKSSPSDTLQITFSEPPLAIDTAHLKLFSVVDSVRTPEPLQLRPTPDNAAIMELITDYRYGTQYLLQVDSAACVGIYGLSNHMQELSFAVETEDKFGSLELTLLERPQQGALYFELLSEDNQVLDSLLVTDSLITIVNIPPATYYARVWVDLNGNGRWDAASYPTSQAEPTYYYPKALAIQAKFATQERWNFYELPIEKQRPSELKPTGRGASDRGQNRERKNLNEEYIQRMRDRYGKRWNPSNKDRKILGLPSRAEERAAREIEEQEGKKKKGTTSEAIKEEKPEDKSASQSQTETTPPMDSIDTLSSPPETLKANATNEQLSPTTTTRTEQTTSQSSPKETTEKTEEKTQS